MKQLLTLSLVPIALLAVASCATAPSAEHSASTPWRVNPGCTRLARSGDAKIQKYCSSPGGDVVVNSGWSSRSCRRVVRPGDGMVVLNFCGNSTEWATFDSWAVSADMTCRWAGTRKELCMTDAKWNGMDAAKWNDLNRRIPIGAKAFDWAETGSNWPAQTGY